MDLPGWSLPNIPRHCAGCYMLYHECVTVFTLLWQINVICLHTSCARDLCYKNVVSSNREAKPAHKTHIRRLNNKFDSDAEDGSLYKF
jgi:hypothetical protein